MFRIEEWFRRPQRKTVMRTNPVTRSEATIHKTETIKPEVQKEAAPMEKTAFEKSVEVMEKELEMAGITEEPIVSQEASETMEEPIVSQEAPENTEEPIMPQETLEADQDVSLQESMAETEELDHISEKIGMDVSEMMDMKKEDFLLQQIDEFREKAKQLQQLMKNREIKAKELQGVVDEREAKANELDSLIHVRKGEADKIMKNVSVRIDTMSAGVRNEMSDLSDSLSKEVSGLTQNLTHELNQSAEKTRQVVEAATQNMIDQNTRSLEGLKEQLEQLGHKEQINELSTEMNSQITTLRTDIADKIHAEDVKCYRNIQASMDQQSKLLSEGDEKTRQHIQEQVDNLSQQMRSQSRLSKVTLAFTILNFLGVAGILAFLILF